MDVRKYEIYFECWPGYLTSEQNEWDILFNIHISKHPCIVLFIV